MLSSFVQKLGSFTLLTVYIWGGYGQEDRLNYRSLLQNNVSFTGLFYKRVFYKTFTKETYNLIDPINQSHPIALFIDNFSHDANHGGVSPKVNDYRESNEGSFDRI